jgi:hypothetical protein
MNEGMGGGGGGEVYQMRGRKVEGMGVQNKGRDGKMYRLGGREGGGGA